MASKPRTSKATDDIADLQLAVSAARSALAVMFAGCAELLAEFGLQVRKERRKLTNEEKAIAAAKAKATRAARHTMGPRAKAKDPRHVRR